MHHFHFARLLGICFVASSLIHWTSGQLIKVGTCPTVNLPVLAPAPNPLNFLAPAATATAVWYEQLRFPTQYEKLLTCVRWTTSQTVALAAPTPATVTVTISGTKKITGIPRIINGVLQTLDPAFLRWTALFPKPAYFGKLTPNHFPRDFIVIGVENLAVPTWIALYSCKSFGPFRIQSVLILTKARIPTQIQLDQAIQTVEGAGISSFGLEAVDQTVCGV